MPAAANASRPKAGVRGTAPRGDPGAAAPTRRGRERERDYAAPWKLDYVDDGFISTLFTQVNRHLGASGALDGVGAGKQSPFPRQLPQGDYVRGGLCLVDRMSEQFVRAENDAALVRLRRRLVEQFDSLIRVFRDIDYNKDGSLTFGELASGLESIGAGGIPRKELRMAFNAMDLHGRGVLDLEAWVRGTLEDNLTGLEDASDEPTPAAKFSSVPLHERPAWSVKQTPLCVNAMALLDRHLKDHPLPDRNTRSPPRAAKCNEDLYSRGDALLIRKEERRLERAQQEEEEIERQRAAAKPKILPKSRGMSQERGSPTEDGARPADNIYKRKMREFLAERRREEQTALTFHPTTCWRSSALFSQYVDDGKQWHERLYDRKGKEKSDRLVVSPKKITKELEENYFRERHPRISEASKKRCRSAEERGDATLPVHERLHRALPRGQASHSDGEEELRLSDGFVVRKTASRSMSFLYRPAKKDDSKYDGEASTVIPPEGTCSLGDLSTFGADSADGFGEISPAERDAAKSPHRLVASGSVVDFLAGMAPFARHLPASGAGVAEHS